MQVTSWKAQREPFSVSNVSSEARNTISICGLNNLRQGDREMPIIGYQENPRF